MGVGGQHTANSLPNSVSYLIYASAMKHQLDGFIAGMHRSQKLPAVLQRAAVLPILVYGLAFGVVLMVALLNPHAFLTVSYERNTGWRQKENKDGNTKGGGKKGINVRKLETVRGKKRKRVDGREIREQWRKLFKTIV